jgi:hypothetical protein
VTASGERAVAVPHALRLPPPVPAQAHRRAHALEALRPPLPQPEGAARGWGWITNPRRAAYNRVYSRTTKGCAVVVGVGLVAVVTAIAAQVLTA